MENGKLAITKTGILYFTVLLLCTFEFLPVVKGYIGSTLEILLHMVAVVIILSTATDKFKQMSLLTVLFLLLFSVRQIVLRTGIDRMSIIAFNTFSDTLFVLYPAYFLWNEENFEEDYLSKIFIFFIVIYTFTQITSIINIGINPEYARLAVAADAYDISKEMSRKNIAGYSYSYFSPLVTCILYFLRKHKRISPVVLVANIVLSIWFLIEIQFTMAIMIYVATVLCLIISRGNKRGMLLVFVLVILIAVFFLPILGQWFLDISDKFESDILRDRLKDVGRVMTGSNIKNLGDINNRYEAYRKSVESFIQNPFFGGKKNGGHSDFLDLAGEIGIMGVVLYVLSFYVYYMYTLKPLKQSKDFALPALMGLVFIVDIVINALLIPSFVFAFSICFCVMCSFIKNIDSRPEPKKLVKFV